MTQRRGHRLGDESGFTIIEVMVAALVLLVGMVGLLLLLNATQVATSSVKAREQAVSLQREIIEAAHGLPYDQLTQNTIVPLVQATTAAGLGDQGASAGWDLRRRDVTYHATLGVCTVDDPGDGVGVHDGTFCATGAGATSAATCADLLGRSGSVQGTAAAASAGAAAGDCGLDRNLDGVVDDLTTAEAGCSGSACGGTADATPGDYKRIVCLVRWETGTGSRYALQVSTIANPGVAGAPGVTDVTATPELVTSTGTTKVDAVATFTQAPVSAAWYLDGTTVGTVTAPGTSWAFTWQLGTVNVAGSVPNPGEVLDGAYAVSAKGFDATGSYNGTRARTVTLNRRRPYPPPAFAAGLNNGVGEIEWGINKEHDIEGYKVYGRAGGTTTWSLVCALTQQTACRDLTPPLSGTTIEYYAVAVDKDTSGSLRDGDPTVVDVVRTVNNPPTAPTLTQLQVSGSTVTLTWTAGSDPDPGDSVDFYRIYRDGQQVADRYDRTTTGTQLTYTDTRAGGLQHTYRVVAVDTGLQESPFSNALTTP